MYSKIVFLLFLNSVFAKDSCDCSEITDEQALQETNDIKEFLMRLSKTAATEEERYPPMPPGTLTGSLGCQCENLRKKRKITPNEGIPLLDETTPRFSKGNCPKGQIRFSPTRCMPIEWLEE